MTETLRHFTTQDAEPCFALFRDAILNGTAPHYSPAQRRAWASDEVVPNWWTPRLTDEPTWITEDNGRISGFLTLRRDGYLDLFFVRPDRRGTATAPALYDAAADYARSLGVEMTTHASLLARPFLERRGWRVGHAEDVARGTETLRRYFMTAPATE